MTIKDRTQIRLRKMGRQYMIVNTSEGSVNLHNVFMLNETGAFLMNKAIGVEAFDEETLATWLMEEYEIDHETALNGARVIVASWRKYNVVTE